MADRLDNSSHTVVSNRRELLADAQSRFSVLAPDGSPLPGDVFVAEDRRMWQFTPKAAWPEGQYQLAGFGRALMPFAVR